MNPIEREIKIENVGTFILKKPKAGERNQATLNSIENGQIVEIKFLMNLLPLCIKSHPYGIVDLKKSLDRLEIEEYDILLKELSLLLQGNNPEEQKKNIDKSSDLTDSQTSPLN